jgi:hypothetical protein
VSAAERQEAPVAHLPVIATARSACREILAQPGRCLHVALLPALLAFALKFLHLEVSEQFPWYLIPGYCIGVLPYLLLGLLWHRVLLLGGRSGGVLQAVTWRRAMTFVGYGAVTVALLGLPFAVVIADLYAAIYFALPAWLSPSGPNAQAISGALLAALLWMAYSAVRISLAFPAAAVDARLGLVGSWRLTRGNGLRIASAVLLIALPFLALYFGIAAAFVRVVAPAIEADRLTLSYAEFVLGSLGYEALQLLGFLFIITVPTLVYRELSGWSGPRDDILERFD